MWVFLSNFCNSFYWIKLLFWLKRMTQDPSFFDSKCPFSYFFLNKTTRDVNQIFSKIGLLLFVGIEALIYFWNKILDNFTHKKNIFLAISKVFFFWWIWVKLLQYKRMIFCGFPLLIILFYRFWWDFWVIFRINWNKKVINLIFCDILESFFNFHAICVILWLI